MKWWILAVPVFVTVTDLGKQCIVFERVDDYTLKCKEYMPYKRYSLKGQENCFTGPGEDCSYMYDIAAGINMERESK